jgi:hypothetical protein
MKHLKIAGLCLVAMLAMSMVIATTATAARVWEECKEVATGTRYETNQCKVAGAADKWGWAEAPAGTPLAIRIKMNTLTLKDTKTLLGEAQVVCGLEGEGVAGGSVAKIEKVTLKSCVGVKVCEKETTAKAVDLPWKTEFFETEKKVFQTLKGTGSGEPGLEVKCVSSLGPIEDKCVTESEKEEHLIDENRVSGSELLLLETFQESRKWDCTIGGKESGVVMGSKAFLWENGMGLRVSGL